VRYFDVAAWLGARRSTANCEIERLEASDQLAQHFNDFKRGGRYLSTPARGLGVLPATRFVELILDGSDYFSNSTAEPRAHHNLQVGRRGGFQFLQAQEAEERRCSRSRLIQTFDRTLERLPRDGLSVLGASKARLDCIHAMN
jgi:hypothetical protein